MRLPEDVIESFESHFDRKPEILVCAPGRVNLIGEHTDYNEGFVLPMAIDRAIWMAISPRPDRRVQVLSADYADESGFDLDDIRRGQGWPEYLKGMAQMLQTHGLAVSGFDAVMGGDIPRGAGLSSSAAVEMAGARAFLAVSGLEWDPVRVAKIGQEVENKWIGVSSGIMDQMVIAAARPGHALFLDCRTLEMQYVPLPSGVSVLVMDTATRRGLIGSAYNERRAQCESAARFFGVHSLRDVSMADFEQRGAGLQGAPHKRAKHIVSENERVLAALDMMRSGESAALGILLNQSHISLRDDFEVSSPALNQMVECAWDLAGCLGARMTGAGFGGCAVALVETKLAQSFSTQVAECYRRIAGLEPMIYLCQASGGADAVKLPG